MRKIAMLVALLLLFSDKYAIAQQPVTIEHTIATYQKDNKLYDVSSFDIHIELSNNYPSGLYWLVIHNKRKNTMTVGKVYNMVTNYTEDDKSGAQLTTVTFDWAYTAEHANKSGRIHVTYKLAVYDDRYLAIFSLNEGGTITEYTSQVNN